MNSDTEKILAASFKFADIEQPKFNGVVNKYKRKVTIDKVVAEWLYFYVAPKKAKVQTCPVAGVKALHYFVEWPNGLLIDLTLDHVNLDNLDYSKIRTVKMNKTPSDEVRNFAADMGYGDDDLDD